MKVVAGLALALLLVGCGSSAPVVRTLNMNPWEVVQIGATSLEDLSSEMRPTMVFDTTKMQVAGTTGCNSYSGSYSMDEFGVEIGPVAATKKACPDMKTEDLFLKALSEVARIDLGEDGIKMFDASGVEVMKAEAK